MIYLLRGYSYICAVVSNLNVARRMRWATAIGTGERRTGNGKLPAAGATDDPSCNPGQHGQWTLCLGRRQVGRPGETGRG